MGAPPDHLVALGGGFWNLRGSFKLGGRLEIGTQASLVQLASGGFVLLDSYRLEGAARDEIFALTDGGRAIEAVLNLHPFHTIHVPAVAAQLPHAKLYGTSRHLAKAPDLPWQPETTDAPELHARFADDLDFTVPRGVDFISDDEKVHFSSVLVFHPASRTLHVDDTLTWVKLPFVRRLIFHPTLAKVLEPRPGAVADFRAWATELAERCEPVDHLCTAHMRPLPPSGDGAPSIAAQVRKALSRVDKTLRAHERVFA